MRRRQFLLQTAAAPAFVRALSGRQADRPNILWILAEDLGPQLACYGFHAVDTPNLDRIAAEGVRFQHAHSTGPVCSASRSAFNVGLYQTATGTHNHRSHRRDGYRLPDGAMLISHRLQQAGYFTANVGEFAPGLRGTRKTDLNFACDPPFQGTHWSQRSEGQPFFAQVNFQATHKGPAFDEARKNAKRVDEDSLTLPPYWPDHPVVRAEYANYLDCVNLLDRQMGTLLDVLRKDNALDNTLVFFFGDNGRCLIRGKQWCYDPGTHVPMFAWGAGVLKAGQVREDPCILLDVTASSLAAARVPLPERFHGQPLFGSAKPRTFVITARDRCDMTVDRIRCVRDGRYAYIRNFMPDRPYTQYNEYIEKQYPTLGAMNDLYAKGKLSTTQRLFMAERKPDIEFYDLRDDPHEVRNLADDPKQKKRIGEYAQRLDEWMKSSPDLGGQPESPEAQAL